MPLCDLAVKSFGFCTALACMLYIPGPMGRFRWFLSLGEDNTWSNERASPTLVHLYRAFFHGRLGGDLPQLSLTKCGNNAVRSLPTTPWLARQPIYETLVPLGEFLD